AIGTGLTSHSHFAGVVLAVFDERTRRRSRVSRAIEVARQFGESTEDIRGSCEQADGLDEAPDSGCRGCLAKRREKVDDRLLQPGIMLDNVSELHNHAVEVTLPRLQTKLRKTL